MGSDTAACALFTHQCVGQKHFQDMRSVKQRH